MRREAAEGARISLASDSIDGAGEAMVGVVDAGLPRSRSHQTEARGVGGGRDRTASPTVPWVGPVVGETASILLAAVRHRQDLRRLNGCSNAQRFIVCRGK